MKTKLVISFVTLSLLLLLSAWGQFSPVEPAHAQQALEEEDAVDTPELLRVLNQEMTLVWLQDEEYANIQTECAGIGLNSVAPLSNGPMVLIPNAGDLSVDGSNVAIKLSSDGQITFIPRTQEQRIRVPMDLGDKVEGQEVLSLSLDEARRLMAAGELIWTAGNHGPYGNGHGLAGHIAECDPRYVAEADEDL